MILPKKHLSTDRSLLYIGAEVLDLLRRPSTVSGLWHAFQKFRCQSDELANVTYDWFVLCLDFLFAVGALEIDSGLLRRKFK
jgi:hypothetical protein